MALQAAPFDAAQDPAQKLKRRLLGQIAPADPAAPLAPSQPLAPAPFASSASPSYAPPPSGIADRRPLPFQGAPYAGTSPMPAAPIGPPVPPPLPPPGTDPQPPPGTGPIPPFQPPPPGSDPQNPPLPPTPIQPFPPQPPGGTDTGQDAQIAALRSRMQAAGGMAANGELPTPEPPPEPGLPPPTPNPVNTPAQPPGVNTAPLIDATPPNPSGVVTNAPPAWLTGGSVNLPGWDPTRTDDDPKQVWGRYVQSKGGHVTGDDVRAFVAADPRWEIDPASSPDDPKIRVKQGELDKWKPGTSIYQDVIKDSGPGGQNIGIFENAGGAQDASGAGQGSSGAPSPMSSMAGRRSGSSVNPSANHPGTGSTEAEWATSKVLSGEWTQEQANDYLGGGGGGGSLTASSSSSTSSPFNDEIRAMLMERMKLAGQPVDENASGISGAVSAARDEQTRAAQDERTQMAERLYAQGGGGLDSNALTQQIQQSGERNAQATSGLRSQLIMKEFGRKAQELQGYMQMALASGDAEMARQIQVQQMQLEAELRREGMGVSLATFMAQLNQNTAMAGLNG